jgi:hypothetical protein
MAWQWALLVCLSRMETKKSGCDAGIVTGGMGLLIKMVLIHVVSLSFV